MAAYDETRNPREYVLNYKTFMELQTHSDALMCKVFPTTLTGPARAWFNSLEPESIKNFIDLASVFINRFIVGLPVKRKMSYLEIMRHRGNESLREYVARFNSEALQIPKIDEGRAVEAMQKGTTYLEFFGWLCRKPPTTLSELMKRTEKYIRQDDALTTSRFAMDDRERGKVGQDKRLDRVEVLVAVQDKDFVQWPKPMKAKASRRDPNKYCQYHKAHDYGTNDCCQLINEIERLIKRGHLRNFLKKLEGQRQQQGAAGERPKRQIRAPINDDSSKIINMIAGGTGGYMSKRGKKRGRNKNESGAKVMQVTEHSLIIISLSSKDARGVQMPHDDTLVIEAVIHNFRVRKVLVDDGSKVNLLPYRVFQQRNILEEHLMRDQVPVKGIEGTSVAVEGKVKVAFTLGESPLSRTHYTVFLIVKLPLSYNAILERSMLYNFEAMTSIRYLSVKFPTKAGVKIIQGRQEETQAVYLAMVDEQCAQSEEMIPEVMKVRDERKEAKTEPVDKLETYSLFGEESDNTFSINSSLEESQKEAAMALIRGHVSSFA
ncbi:uncharacterized protein LOC110604945 [Manihot esculenta]|uniref:uncharacterized protein LOC110604945 n=1 Tax=Manihot esculenta TaxID=3983 RepID=UPI000B5D19D1|nr:uncharacterized protein LOC110604945 [Manihot esculenta]